MSSIDIRGHPKYYDVYISGPQNNLKLYTKNLVPGRSVYGERLVSFRDVEYREWDPFRSKLAALLLKNPTSNFLSKDMNCLYLGASSGTTISHLSDIVKEGVIFGVEFATRSIRQLIQNTSERTNIIPILGDAIFPASYAKSIFTEIELVYQDVAQPNQAEIAVDNCNYYLKKGGFLILAIKSQSIDSLAKIDKVYSQEKKILERSGYEIVESVNIDRFAEKHIVLIAKKKII